VNGGRRLDHNVFRDDLFTLKDDVDQTKKLRFQLSGISAGETRVLTIPDMNGTILLAGQDCPELVDISDTSVAEGNNSIANFEDKVLINVIEIATTSTDWTLTVYGDDGYSSHAREIVSNRSGDFKIYWNAPYEDEDGTKEFHYNFASASGSETHDVRILGLKLR